MKYALIGCGRIAKNHVSAAIANKLEIVALCDIIYENAKRYVKENNLQATIYLDYKEMLENEKLDFVAIATESGKHFQIAFDCINAGINVLIEKPLALSISDADKLIALAKEKNVIVGVCHQNRFNKAVKQLRQATRQNQLGKIFNIQANIFWNRDKNYYSQAPWRGTWEQDGGCLMNQCIHNIDLLLWLMNSDVSEIFGSTSNIMHDYIEAEDFGTAIVKFKNGSVGNITGTVNVYPENFEETLTIFAEKGTVRLGGNSVNKILYWNVENVDIDIDAFNEEPPNVYGFGHTPLYENFIQSIENHTQPFITLQDGKNAMETVLGIYKSSESKMPISMPLKDCKTVDFKR